ncbi:hypothetical protein AB0B01_22440 [Streptomyces sp. NPDC044571]|uniref:hypothetical protein n=1 Tax=Streptomyces sp. NPDC044571 TaxID=3155371 RepID=UPI0033C3746A
MNDIHRELRDAAQAHRPDRDKMLDRVRRGMADAPDTRLQARETAHHRPPAVSWARVGLATAAVATALVAVAFALSPTGPEGERSGQVATAPQDTTSPAAQSGPLWSSGAVDPHSNPYWAQGNITLQNGQPLSTLTLQVRIAQTGGVATTGTWQTRPGEDFEVSTVQTDGATVYRWTLKAGRTVPPGRHVFAVQYNHAEGDRDARKDTYEATATTAAGRLHEVGGTFP